MKDYKADYMNYFFKTRVLDDGTEVMDWNHDNSIYNPVSDFFVDFSIAEKSGTESVRSTYDKIISEYSDYIHLTELVLVLDSKCCEYGIAHYGSDMHTCYENLYNEAYSYVENYLRNDTDGKKYFYLVTDYGTENPWVYSDSSMTGV